MQQCRGRVMGSTGRRGGHQWSRGHDMAAALVRVHVLPSRVQIRSGTGRPYECSPPRTCQAPAVMHLLVLSSCKCSISAAAAGTTGIFCRWWRRIPGLLHRCRYRRGLCAVHGFFFSVRVWYALSSEWISRLLWYEQGRRRRGAGGGRAGFGASTWKMI